VQIDAGLVDLEGHWLTRRAHVGRLVVTTGHADGTPGSSYQRRCGGRGLMTTVEANGVVVGVEHCRNAAEMIRL
jgi:hypothetical protein